MSKIRPNSDGNLSPPGDDREFEADYTSAGPEPQPGIDGVPVRWYDVPTVWSLIHGQFNNPSTSKPNFIQDCPVRGET
ncbi:hypothetical protein RSAG8_04959, partial [Rhizoctonia solani AG-8 WAC10335]